MLQVDVHLLDRICENLHIGMPLDLAAEAEGVARSTVRGWIAAFPDVSGRVTRSKAEGAKNLHIMSVSGEKYGTLALAHLERRFPEYYRPAKDDAEKTEIRILVEGGLPRE